MESNIETWDWVVIGVYFALVLAVGVWCMFSSKKDSVSGYFLGGRSMTWITVGASLFGSNIGSEHFIGLAGTGAIHGIAVGAYEWNSMLVLLLLGYFFVPVYLSSCVVTMPHYLNQRLGSERVQIFLTCLSLLLYILTKISANLYNMCCNNVKSRYIDRDYKFHAVQQNLMLCMLVQYLFARRLRSTFI